MQGKCKWFSEAKGYGFISPNGGGKDVFVHYTALQKNGTKRRNLVEGVDVTFDIVDGPKGKMAQNVIEV